MNICHLTSVHSRYDTRIFIKECRSLADAGYDVTLVVADGQLSESRDNVRIIDVGVPPQKRINRILNTPKLVFKAACDLDADLYHLHDPELIPIGQQLKKQGKKIIFDAHEDVPKQILSKPYLNGLSRNLLSWTFSAYEKKVCGQFDAIISATPSINAKYCQFNSLVSNVNNYPILGELSTPTDWSNKQQAVCYIGGIALNRGAVEIVQALSKTQDKIQLFLAGKSFGLEVDKAMQRLDGWLFVKELGFLDREGIRDILSLSMAGLVTLHPTLNYLESLPIKMFEYMSAGIPVIASNFPLWRNIIETHNCGICVDPFDSEEIAQAIDTIVANPSQSQQMGKNGLQAVQEFYNWSNEAEKLINVYKTILT